MYTQEQPFSINIGHWQLIVHYYLNHSKQHYDNLHLDVYEPTLFALEKLYDKVKKGGLILIDDYGIASGITKAVNEFKKIRKIKIKKIGNLSYFKI